MPFANTVVAAGVVVTVCIVIPNAVFVTTDVVVFIIDVFCLHFSRFLLLVDVSVNDVSTYISFVVIDVFTVGRVLGIDGSIDVFVVGVAFWTS